MLKADGVEVLHFLTKSGGLYQKTVRAKLGDSVGLQTVCSSYFILCILSVLPKVKFLPPFSQRPDCISNVLQANGITTKNPEEAVTKNFLCTGGVEPERDHIACTGWFSPAPFENARVFRSQQHQRGFFPPSGDSGGAVFKNFERRTVQVSGPLLLQQDERSKSLAPSACVLFKVGLVSWGTVKLCEGGGLFESNDKSRDFHVDLFQVKDFLKRILANNTQNDYEPLVFLDD